MEGLKTQNEIEGVGMVNKNMEAQGRVSQMFNNYKRTPEKVIAHGIEPERI